MILSVTIRAPCPTPLPHKQSFTLPCPTGADTLELLTGGELVPDYEWGGSRARNAGRVTVIDYDWHEELDQVVPAVPASASVVHAPASIVDITDVALVDPNPTGTAAASDGGTAEVIAADALSAGAGASAEDVGGEGVSCGGGGGPQPMDTDSAAVPVSVPVSVPAVLLLDPAAAPVAAGVPTSTALLACESLSSRPPGERWELQVRDPHACQCVDRVMCGLCVCGVRVSAIGMQRRRRMCTSACSDSAILFACANICSTHTFHTHYPHFLSLPGVPGPGRTYRLVDVQPPAPAHARAGGLRDVCRQGGGRRGDPEGVHVLHPKGVGSVKIKYGTRLCQIHLSEPHKCGMGIH